MKESKHPVVSIEFILTVFMHHIQKWLHGNLEKGLILCGIISKYISILFILMNGLYIGRVLIFFFLKHEIEGLWLFGSVSRLVSSAEDWLLGRDCRLVRIKA